MYIPANYMYLKDVYGSYETYLSISKQISLNLEDALLTAFGPTNTDGKFQDIERIKKFLSEAPQIDNILNYKIVFNSGSGDYELSWLGLIKERYEDMLAKIQDTKHIYKFDKLGEALLVVLCDNLVDKEVTLEYYEDNKDRYAKRRSYPLYYLIKPIHRIDECHNLSDKIYEALKIEYSQNLAYEFLSEELINDENIALFAHICADMMSLMYTYYGYYTFEGAERFRERCRVISQEFKAETWNYSGTDKSFNEIISSVKKFISVTGVDKTAILWDADYEIALDNLNDTDDTGYSFRSLNQLATDDNDIVAEVQQESYE